MLHTENNEQDADLCIQPNPTPPSLYDKPVDHSDKLTINILYVIAYTICYGLGTWHCAFAIAGNGQTTKVFEAKFDWDKDDTIFYNTVISS